LAQRSAKAPKRLQSLIEGSVKKVEAGTSIANETAKALEEIVTGITKVTDLVGEIASASNEQAQGIDQINTGLSQIDQVTQSNTANAEESASAAEELSSQALQLKQILSKFTLKNESGQIVSQTLLRAIHTEMNKPERTSRSPQKAGRQWQEERIHMGWRCQNLEESIAAVGIALDDKDFGRF